MRKNLSIFALGGVLGIFTLNFVLNANNITENAIKSLQSKNDSLLKANFKIDSLNYVLHNKLKEEDNQITILFEKDNYQQSLIKDLNTRIKTLNKKYEKASNYSNNYNNNEISSYFSNLR